MNVYARFDEIPSMTLKDIKNTKHNGRTEGQTDRQRENSIPTHKHSLQGYNKIKPMYQTYYRVDGLVDMYNIVIKINEKITGPRN